MDAAGGGFPVDILWTIIAAILVFWMQAGFALVEAGFTRAKNVVNIMMKNIMDFSVGSLLFWIIGFGFMFGQMGENSFIGTAAFMYAPDGMEDAWFYTFLIFQTVFAATAATIVSGAMAERTKFGSYLLYSIGITAFVYPIFGGWAWGSLWTPPDADASGGWLEGMGFMDFAGSTVVHSVGGWAALAGALVLGPRLGKYQEDGTMRPIPGHSMAFAVLGMFILWMGWFGFNPGSTTAVTGEGRSLAIIMVNTNISACAGAIAAMVTSWILLKKPDVSMAVNGALAGLVAITAPCANVAPGGALLIGLIGGVIVVFSVLFFDKIKIDDPVGAISVHGVCGAWGTIAVALFDVTGDASFGVQLLGIGVGFAWAFGASLAIFLTIKYTVGLRVSKEEEIEGLDLHEHGAKAWVDLA
ncbi:MAG: ammonium transporter [Planctomycetota bacterium]